MPNGRVCLALAVGTQGEPKTAVGEGWQGLPEGLLVGREAVMAAFGAALDKGPWAGGARAAHG